MASIVEKIRESTGPLKNKTNRVFGKISAYKQITELGGILTSFISKIANAKEYDSVLDLLVEILRSLGINEEWVIRNILQAITGDVNIASMLERGYHGTLGSLENILSKWMTEQENSKFLTSLEDAVKITISTILTAFMTCSISPFIPYYSIDWVYKKKLGSNNPLINIPTHILDISNTLHVSPVSESGVYFYNTGAKTNYYQRIEVEPKTKSRTIPENADQGAVKNKVYTYKKLGPIDYKKLTEDQLNSFKRVVSVPKEIEQKASEAPPDEFIYTCRPAYTAESLYKTDDMNAFIWYVTNRGDNYDESKMHDSSPDHDVIYEYNKMAWDSRRINAYKRDDARTTPEDWESWLTSRKNWGGEPTGSTLVLIKGEDSDAHKVKSLYPILQLEPTESYGDLPHIVATFPGQRYLAVNKDFPGTTERSITSVIYHFNADYLRSIKIFNWKPLILNLLYELNNFSPIPDVSYNLSLSDEIIDARLSTLILRTIEADDKEIDDSFFSFSNEEYIDALKRTELRKYGAKEYNSAGSSAIQNPPNNPLDTINSTSTAATLNEVQNTITRGVYEAAGTSGSTGVTKTELSFNLSYNSNIIKQLIAAIIKPLVRAILSPQIMLLFCINLDVMGIVNLSDLSFKDYSVITDFIFKKLAAIIKKLIVQIKDFIVKYLLELVKKELKKLIDKVTIIIALEQLNDYIRLLNQIMECLSLFIFKIGRTINGEIDDVRYADIIPVANAPEKTDDT